MSTLNKCDVCGMPSAEIKSKEISRYKISCIRFYVRCRVCGASGNLAITRQDAADKWNRAGAMYFSGKGFN